MMPILAETSVTEAVAVISTSVSVLGGAAVTLYFIFRKKKTEADADDGKAKREAKKYDAEIAFEGKKRETDETITQLLRFIEEMKAAHKADIDGLKRDVADQKNEMMVFQKASTIRAQKTEEAHHQCELKYAALEVRLQHEIEKNTALEHRIKSLEGDRE